MTEFDKFQSSTMLENYKRLLSYINSQMDTDEIDLAERQANTMKSYIQYYLENIDNEYKSLLDTIIPLEILKEKILDVPFGFGNIENDEDNELYNIIKCYIYDEIKYRETTCKCATIDTTQRYQCW